MKTLRRCWLAYTDWLARLTRGERALLIVDLVILLSLWVIFFLLLTIVEKVIAHHHV